MLPLFCSCLNLFEKYIMESDYYNIFLCAITSDIPVCLFTSDIPVCFVFFYDALIYHRHLVSAAGTGR